MRVIEKLHDEAVATSRHQSPDASRPRFAFVAADFKHGIDGAGRSGLYSTLGALVSVATIKSRKSRQLAFWAEVALSRLNYLPAV